jgi:hypothetical protein
MFHYIDLLLHHYYKRKINLLSTNTKNSEWLVVFLFKGVVVMRHGQQASENLEPLMKPGFAGTDSQKVKQEIQKDVSRGQGAMTSREAGGMRD